MKRPMIFTWIVAIILGLVAPAASQGSYFQPNSTGIKLQNGYERVYIQAWFLFCLYL